MKTLRIVLLALMALAGNGSFVQANPLQVVADSGFESGVLTEHCWLPAPIQTGGWAAGRMCEGIAEVVTNVVHSGSRALHIDTTATRGRIAYQDFDGATDCYAFRVWLYRASGRHLVDVNANWDRGYGEADVASRVFIGAQQVTFSGWNGSTTLDYVLESNAWHEVMVVAKGPAMSQTLFIDGEHVGDLVGTSSWAPETVFLGDVSGSGSHGDYYYDDVSLQVGGADPDADGVAQACMDNCPDDTNHDALPPDNNNDKTVDVLDMLNYKPKLLPPYDPRYDLNVDGVINVLDVLLYKPVIRTSCTNP